MQGEERDSQDEVDARGSRPAGRRSIAESPFCGMWKDRLDMEDVHEYLRRLRRPRYEHLFREWREERSGRQLSEGQNGQ